MIDRQFIPLLTREVERKCGRQMLTPRDFQWLADQLPQGERLSLSTLKRVWNYVPSVHTPGEDTLSILARMAGWADWTDFCRQYVLVADSDFLDGTIRADDVAAGDELLLAWLPDRTMRIMALGGCRFRVVEVSGGKLRRGDEFDAVWFSEGQPLCLSGLRRRGHPLPDYIAGRRTGLTAVTRCP